VTTQQCSAPRDHEQRLRHLSRSTQRVPPNVKHQSLRPAARQCMGYNHSESAERADEGCRYCMQSMGGEVGARMRASTAVGRS
jgi:hypothetical protein